MISELCFRFPPILSEFKRKPVDFLIILGGTEVSWLNSLNTGNEFGDDPLHKRSSSFLSVPYSNRGSRKSQIQYYTIYWYYKIDAIRLIDTNVLIIRSLQINKSPFFIGF